MQKIVSTSFLSVLTDGTTDGTAHCEAKFDLLRIISESNLAYISEIRYSESIVRMVQDYPTIQSGLSYVTYPSLWCVNSGGGVDSITQSSGVIVNPYSTVYQGQLFTGCIPLSKNMPVLLGSNHRIPIDTNLVFRNCIFYTNSSGDDFDLYYNLTIVFEI